MIDSASSCICDSSSTSISVDIDMNLNYSTLCDIDSLKFDVCVGTGDYSGRTYSWYDVDGLGRTMYLSDVSVLNPTFTPPTVTTTTIFRYAIQVNRGGCVDEDTISIEVKA